MKQDLPIKEVEVIKLTVNGEEDYHIKPSNAAYRFYRSVKIPAKLFENYIKSRSAMLDYRKQIRSYFKPVTDKPFTIGKNIRPGDVHHFNDDGSVTITPKEEL